MPDLNIFFDNEYELWKPNETDLVDITKKILYYYMSCPDVYDNCCLKGYEYNSVSFDFLLCDSKKTHVVNKEYRGKDYPADIITFAVFADSQEDERFVLDSDINLGEIIISLDKMIEGAKEKGISKETELYFFISHGILHLLGFDHQTEMEYDFVINHQKKALGSLGIVYDKI